MTVSVTGILTMKCQQAWCKWWEITKYMWVECNQKG